ncbi:MAG TPA: hypothetical protein VHL80_20150 [Polyangia bacterium]|nr:hypothetical protein [Polyangia bacterium]
MTRGVGASRRRAEPDGGRPGRPWRRAAVACLLSAAALLAGPAARAEAVYDLLPSATLGITDNAKAAPTGSGAVNSGAFSTLTALGRIHKLTMRSDSSLGLRVGDTFYLYGGGPNALTLELAAVSAMTLDASWQLRLAAATTYGQTSSPTKVELNSALPTVLPSAANPYLSASASAEGLFEASPRTRLVQALRFSGVDYLNRGSPPMNSIGVPAVQYSFVLGALLRFERDVGDNLLVAEGDVADCVAPGRESSGVPNLADQVWLTELVAGWRRDFGLTWSAELKAGALGIFDDLGTHFIEPAVNGTVGYRQLYWFATVTASQQAAPNVFIAAATLNDAVLARLALPIGTSERYYAIGYGGYTYARLVDTEGIHKGYQLWTGGASLTARSKRYPIWGSIDYTISSQEGNLTSGGTIPTLERQQVMVTIGGAFTTGNEPPPIFHGIMGAIRPLSEQSSGSPAGNPSSFGTGAGPLETPGAPGWSGSPEARLPANGAKPSTVVPVTPGAPGWSGTPTTTETPGAPGWSGSKQPQ